MIMANAVTPSSSLSRNEMTLDHALAKEGVFCVATYYWEFDTQSVEAGAPTVAEHLRKLIVRAQSDSRVVWRSVGEIVLVGSPKV